MLMELQWRLVNRSVSICSQVLALLGFTLLYFGTWQRGQWNGQLSRKVAIRMCAPFGCVWSPFPVHSSMCSNSPCSAPNDQFGHLLCGLTDIIKSFKIFNFPQGASSSPKITLSLPDACRDYQFRVLVVLRATNPREQLIVFRPKPIPAQFPAFVVPKETVRLDRLFRLPSHRFTWIDQNSP